MSVGYATGGYAVPVCCACDCYYYYVYYNNAKYALIVAYAARSTIDLINDSL